MLANHGRYLCYESIIAIVTNHYRTPDDGAELDARKSLTTALMELSSLKD